MGELIDMLKNMNQNPIIMIFNESREKEYEIKTVDVSQSMRVWIDFE